MKRILAVFVLLCASAAYAHKPSDSYLTLNRHEASIEGQWSIALRDLDHALGLDLNRDGGITWGEVRGRSSRIDRYTLDRLQLRDASGTCTLRPTEHLIDRYSDGTYLVLRFSGVCPSGDAPLTISYRLLFDLDRQHRGILRIGDDPAVYLFTADTPTHQVSLGNDAPPWRVGLHHVLDVQQLLFIVLLTFSLGRRIRAARPWLDYVRILLALVLGYSLPLALRSIDLPIPASTPLLSVLLALGIVMSPSPFITLLFGMSHGATVAAALGDESSLVVNGGLALGLALQLLAVSIGVGLINTATLMVPSSEWIWALVAPASRLRRPSRALRAGARPSATL